MRKRVITSTAVALGLMLAIPASAAGAGPGDPGIGDPYYPTYGNGGYDVSHYDLNLDYQLYHRPAVRHRHDHGDRDPGADQLRPGLRARREQGTGQRPYRAVRQ